MAQRGTQVTGLGVMIGRSSPNSQHRRPDHHPVNVSYSFFRYPNDDLRSHYNQRHKRKTWTRGTTNLHNTAILGATFHNEDIGKELEILQGCAGFQTTNQRLADQVSNKERLVF